MTQTTTTSQTDSRGFVSIQRTSLDQSSLDQLIRRCITGNAWQCLQWPDKTTFSAGLPSEFSGQEGQVFTQDRELRWKRQGSSYKVLLLSKTEINDPALKPLAEKQQWLIRDLNTNFHSRTETRLPWGVTYPKDLDIGQRYFIDRETGIVQFVALRERPHG